MRANPFAAVRPYHRTEQGANGTHLVLVCAWVYPNTLPSVHTGGRACSPRTADVSSPLRPVKSRSGRGVLCSSGRSCCVAHRGAGIDQHQSGVPGRACGADTTLGRSPGHGPGDRCKAIHVAEFGAGRFISWGSERDDSAAWSYLAGSGVEPLPAITARPRSGPDPIRAADSGDDIALG